MIRTGVIKMIINIPFFTVLRMQCSNSGKNQQGRQSKKLTEMGKCTRVNKGASLHKVGVSKGFFDNSGVELVSLVVAVGKELVQN